jgi:tRNA (adenine37-N6)-methyltransferase
METLRPANIDSQPQIIRRDPVKTDFQIYPIGFIDKYNDITEIIIDGTFSEALLGLDSFSHIHVIYWFHQNDTPEKRKILRVHPRKNKQNPLTGVFATHSPVRPNLLAMSICEIVSIKSNRIRIHEIDAHHGSPVLDIKCYIPPKKPLKNIHLPDWV